jgi:hypothetical protein
MTSGIVRRGDTVRRPTGPWSLAVHEYLRHLESTGFTGAPRVLATEPGFEVLSYLDGDVADDPDWEPGHGARLPGYARPDEALAGAADLIGRLHAASAGFEPRHTDYRFHPHVEYASIGPTDAAITLEFHARELRWLDTITPDLARAL